ncbi:glycoside hydrolase family 20 zincin-like fold domain-containing protein [Cellulomonas bogoriensis]|uniref:glycoside hydrolase family 20 zincin-like fold domain-containing protein n=1 Tax=Cellulomonas bogoriensis TaxID=301388 RepID=UPI0018DC37CD|nr:glycoside hydrolase family 20 zincin-like fold domain-containing protein [Cellulomonas bogoriensis]
MPAPVHVSRSPGKATFLLSGMRVVSDPDPVAVGVAVLVATRVGDLGGFPVAVVQEDDGEPGAVVLQLVSDPLDAGLPVALDAERSAEAYSLEVTGGRAVVTAVRGCGLLRGVATLNQLARPVRVPTPRTRVPGGADDGPDPVVPDGAPPCETHVLVPAVRVTDHPRYLWRGVALDPRGHELTVDGVAGVLAVMSSLKLNVLRLPVDRGWDEEGGRAGAATIGAVLTHAAARGVTVVPGLNLALCGPDQVDQVTSVSPGPWVDLSAGWSAASAAVRRDALGVLGAAGRRVVCRACPPGERLPAGSVVLLDGTTSAPLTEGVLGLSSWSDQEPDLRATYLREPSTELPELTVHTTAGAELVLTGLGRGGVRDHLEALTVVAEVGWAAPARRSWDAFCSRLTAQGLTPSQATTGAGATTGTR